MEIKTTTATYARIRVEATGEYAIGGIVTINNEGAVMPMPDTRTGAINNGIVKDSEGKQIATFQCPSEDSLSLNYNTKDSAIRQAVLTEVQDYCASVRTLIADCDIIINPKTKED